MPNYIGTRYTTRARDINLLHQLVSYWKLEEASGTRNDSYGANHLTDNNTVTQNTGKLSSAAEFTASNNEYLSIADNASLSMGAGVRFTIAAWAYFASGGAVRNLVAKRAGLGGLEYYLRFVSGPNQYNLEVSPDGSTPVTSVYAATYGTPPNNTWHFIVAGYDGARLLIQVNNGKVDTTAYTSDVFNGGEAFQISGYNGSNEVWDGRIDSVGLWKRWLNDAERTYLFNAGMGREFPWS